MSMDQLKSMVNSLTKQFDDNQSLSLPLLLAKMERCHQENLGDQTLGQMHQLFAQLAQKHSLIKKAEFKACYQKLYTRGTVFGELFASELGIVAKPEIDHTVKTASKKEEQKPFDVYANADPVLANALPHLFDKSMPAKMYSKTMAEQAQKMVEANLEGWGLKAHSISTVAGNETFLVVQADYETPKGKTSFYVPIEIKGSKALIPSMLVGNGAPQPLNHITIKNYVLNNVGTKLALTPVMLLDAIIKSAENKQEISQTELAMIRLKAARQENQANFFAPQILGVSIPAAPKPDVQMPKVNDPKMASLEQQFTSPAGKAALRFGKDLVQTGASHLARQLQAFGFHNPQLTILNSDDKSISFGVSVDGGNLAFSVPLKISNGKLNKPEVLLCNGEVQTFDAEGLTALKASARRDFKVAAATSPQYGLKPADLLNNVRQGVSDHNLAAAEDALNVLAHSDQHAFKAAFEVFKKTMAHQNNPEHQPSKCQHMYQTANSQLPVCKVTNLTIDKVYQDDHGNCQPLYRRGMAEASTPALLNNAKVLGII